jgi:ATP-dependent exoDNAse (exonuclease V) beta subunit
VAQLVRNWGEGLGAAADALPPSIFIVGDRKQSIYGFRDAEVAVLDEAGAFVEALRADGDPRRAISVSFRAVPEILAFVNEVFAAVEKSPARADAFRYAEHDRFPVETTHAAEPSASASAPASAVDGSAVSFIAGENVTDVADRVAGEITSLIGNAVVRDRATGVARAAVPSDIAILFRSRDYHREFEKALEQRGLSTYVYKGLGFFDAEEIQDAVALIRYLADPASDLRAAAFLRSRLARLSDRAIAGLAPDGLASGLLSAEGRPVESQLDDEDRRVLAQIRPAVARWLAQVDRVTPAELLGAVLHETGYEAMHAGPRFRQARENVKKLRAMVRRFQNRGYATLARVADHLEQLAVGDESNAAIDATGSVSLMTVHAAKGLEFPVVFVVNMNRGTGNTRAPIRVSAGSGADASVAIADYQSDADEDSTARDREETKRLLYVALTRARDRLYLAAALTPAGFKPTRGSLGEVLPAFVRERFGQAFAARDQRAVSWR